MPEALPVPAVATVTAGGEQSLLALTSLDTVWWEDQVAWMAVPAAAPGESEMVTGYTLGPPSDSALVFWARGGREDSSGARAPILIHSLPLGQGRGNFFAPEPDPVAEEGPLPDWCGPEGWIAAFLLDGVGPRPSHPVVVEYRASGEVHRLLVDPERNTVRGEPTLRVHPVAAEAGDGPHRRLRWGVQLDTAHSDLVPLLVAWGGRASMPPGSAHGRSHGLSATGSDDDPIQEWRAYFLFPPAGHPRRQADGVREPCEDGSPDVGGAP
jgi:hypothetical protein